MSLITYLKLEGRHRCDPDAGSEDAEVYEYSSAFTELQPLRAASTLPIGAVSVEE